MGSDGAAPPILAIPPPSGSNHQKRIEGHEIGSVRCPACSTLCGFLYDDAIGWLILPGLVGWLVLYTVLWLYRSAQSVAWLSRAVRIELRWEELCFCRVGEGGAGARLVGYRKLRSVGRVKICIGWLQWGLFWVSLVTTLATPAAALKEFFL